MNDDFLNNPIDYDMRLGKQSDSTESWEGGSEVFCDPNKTIPVGDELHIFKKGVCALTTSGNDASKRASYDDAHEVLQAR